MCPTWSINSYDFNILSMFSKCIFFMQNWRVFQNKDAKRFHQMSYLEKFIIDSNLEPFFSKPERYLNFAKYVLFETISLFIRNESICSKIKILNFQHCKQLDIEDVIHRNTDSFHMIYAIKFSVNFRNLNVSVTFS